MRKRMLTMFLTICLIFTMLPVGALAVETPPEPASMDESASPSSVTDPFAMLSEGGITAKDDLVAALASGSGDVVLGGDITVNDEQLNVGRNVTLDLNGHHLTVTLERDKGNTGNGIKIASGVTFTLRDSSSSSTGKLTVTNKADSKVIIQNGAAINTTGSALVIESGTVYAKGGAASAGIGGGYQGSGGTVTITGGTVNATGGEYGAGIGGGAYYANGGTVTISGGTVTATGGGRGAGIGGGSDGSGGTVNISGGTVNATGNASGAGIGGGGSWFVTGGSGGTVTISGGMVTANGGASGAGIGGGEAGASGSLTIIGGSVRPNNMGGSNAAIPKGSDGSTQLYPATLTVKERSSVANAALDGDIKKTSSGSLYPYKTKDVKTHDYGKVYFWLPADTYDIALRVGNTSYTNENVTVVAISGITAELITAEEKKLRAKLRAAVANGGVYQLLTDGETSELILTTELQITKNFTLDLNGHNLAITLDATEGMRSNGIKIASGVTFTIRDSSNRSTGRLTVTNNASSATAGNGAAINTSDGTLVIESGTVYAKGGAVSAGIGGGYQGSGGTVTITGGAVTATGSVGGAGIGGGYRGSGGTVTITGGTVTATANDGDPGIGGGDSGSPGSVTISGGSIRANNMDESNAAVPKGSDGRTLYLTTLTVKGGSSVANAALARSGHTIKSVSSPYSYGTKDVKTDADGKVYFYLPEDTYSIALKVGRTLYTNDTVEVTADSGGAADLIASASSGSSSSDSYNSRTLTDANTGLTVSGALSRSATLRVNSFTPARDTTDPAHAAIIARMDSLQDMLIFCADIMVSGNCSGPLTLSFEVGDQYNGQTVTLMHAKNGKLMTYTAVVKNGTATFTVTSLSPFALFAPVNVID